MRLRPEQSEKILKYLFNAVQGKTSEEIAALATRQWALAEASTRNTHLLPAQGIYIGFAEQFEFFAKIKWIKEVEQNPFASARDRAKATRLADQVRQQKIRAFNGMNRPPKPGEARAYLVRGGKRIDVPTWRLPK